MYVNIHCMNVRSRDDRLARALDRAGLVYCDGTGVRLASWMAGIPLPERMTGADWINDLCRQSVRDSHSLYLLGSGPDAANRAARMLCLAHPGLNIVGTASGYDVSPGTITEINGRAPDILLVGMGTPTQELWIDDHRAELAVPVVWAVGALFDFVSGKLPRGPRWMTDHGFEWLCRLTAEPRKLWRRYLIGNPWFFWRIVRTYWLRRCERG